MSMKSEEEIRKTLEGLDAAYDMSTEAQIFEPINNYISALRWVLGD